ncbi:ABC transporter [Candidatus Roizmanbacteria bacterium RIFCSPHIGHO2_01_FULL_39_8]|uniref:ABC transporter n=3 Tax=Candidatus Roizmaniibacteriota TaxID=1752723 RepID=A0A1F7GJH6_9BACT|nr:MAG: ABC transporter [Candidatus Roizmanbacteria bacterium RIFCSPHIGHO2_01_FULL_39_8]OGK26306.1 MAG: ABC transporter [Candidatus Roizmanbacteria bacterium RIFCSPHIGHO2_02_FULL_39_9]OGK35010.1 MAG: ABC transporter [Candidatus Roizmanbacteria bacterium RIFCSPHIGHO2_12_FULL_39_8]
MIQVKNLTKIYKTTVKGSSFFSDLFNRKYKEVVALDKVSFEIAGNELVGFIGPNGAGKTTTLKILAGILYPTSGQVNVLDYFPFDKKRSFLKQIAFVMGQRNQLLWDLPALDTFQLNKEIYEVSDDRYHQIVDELTSLLNAENLVEKPVKTLSLGERMKMELIATLIHNPKLIFFDEPTIGLDLFSQEIIREFIKKYQKQYRATIMLTSHYMEDVKRLAKRIIVINKGKILYDGNLKEIVQKYSSTKLVTVVLESKIDQIKLSSIGNIISYVFPKVSYKIDRHLIPEKIDLINRLLPYMDLTIEEEPIEEIIKKLFSGKK